MAKARSQKDRFMELVSRSPIAFAGTIKALGASSLKAVPAESSMAVVRVDDTLWSPAVLGNLKGKTITLRLTKGGLQPGRQAVFFATSWLYADGIAVIEVDRMTGKLDHRELRRRIADAQIALLDQALAARLTRATLVVSGAVTKVERLGKDEPLESGDLETEWRVATVLVSTVEKGKLRGSAEVRVLFPGDSEEKWNEAPRFSEGQQGIWILGKYEEDKRQRDEREASALTALNPLDFQLLNQIDRVRALLARGR